VKPSSTYNNSPASKPSEKKPLGQLLNEAGLISAKQIEIALQEQVEIPQMKIGEILVLRGWLKQKTADFFVEQWEQLLQQEQKHLLVYYFRQAALLNDNQIKLILEQRNNSQTARFHHIAVQKGLIDQQTVDFFIKNLLSPSKSQKSSDLVSFATAYKILQNYIRGETNFQRSELKKIKLNHVTLRVNLDSYNLTRAKLKQANLSNSSLRLVNLTGANLEGSNFRKAILREADLRHGYLVNVCFADVDLRSIKLQGANLTGAFYDR
jgi:uncharacterized protein YjbI with pentapeptide repeats